MANLLMPMITRLVTAVTSPFRMLIVRVLRTFNVNVISAKLIQPLTKNVRKLLTLRPSEKSDYIRIGRFLVFKQLLALLVLAACAGVFIYFSVFAKQIETAPVSLIGIKTDVTFHYDDIEIKKFTGTANIKSFDGGIVYTGEIDAGVCKGNGFLYARDGRLVYEGSFDNNRYNGYGVKYNADGKVEYEGEFVDDLYHGTGSLYNAKGGILYSGDFAAGQYAGVGMLYDENGGLVYEGSFAAGKNHGTGTRYYSGGILHYRGEFFDGFFQGTGELYDKNGRLLYSGNMRGGEINYRALVGATLADLEAAFSETPSIYYQEDGNSCFFYEQAGVIITADCRVKVYEWEREKENPSDGFYYMPDEEFKPPEEYAYNAAEYGENQAYAEAFDNDESEYTDAFEEMLPDSILARQGSLTLTPVNWVIIDPYTPESSESSSGSSSVSESSASSITDSLEASQEDIFSNSESEASKPDSGDAGNGLPDFVDKTKMLYFEIDKDIWQPENELDKTKVFVKRVTVLGSQLPPENAVTPIEDNGQPGVEDCVAIDYIRRHSPTAFSDVAFEMDKQNKLFQRVRSINYADRVLRETFIADNVTYRFCYQPDQTEVPAYYSIEAQ